MPGIQKVETLATVKLHLERPNFVDFADTKTQFILHINSPIIIRAKNI